MLRRLCQTLVAVAVLSVAAPALAQEETEMSLAEAKAVADEVIVRGNATAYFDVASEPGLPAIRHRRSGLICLLAEDPQASSITVYDSGLPVGDDVSCSTQLSGNTVTLYATRYQPKATDDEVVAGAVEAIHKNWQNVKQYEGGIRGPSKDGLPPITGAAFLAERDGRKLYTQVMVATVGDWGFKLRITTAEDGVETAQSLGAGLFGYALDQAQTKPGKD